MYASNLWHTEIFYSFPQSNIEHLQLMLQNDPVQVEQLMVKLTRVANRRYVPCRAYLTSLYM